MNTFHSVFTSKARLTRLASSLHLQTLNYQSSRSVVNILHKSKQSSHWHWYHYHNIIPYYLFENLITTAEQICKFSPTFNWWWLPVWDENIFTFYFYVYFESFQSTLPSRFGQLVIVLTVHCHSLFWFQLVFSIERSQKSKSR